MNDLDIKLDMSYYSKICDESSNKIISIIYYSKVMAVNPVDFKAMIEEVILDALLNVDKE